jgi:hypothetical protein
MSIALLPDLGELTPLNDLDITIKLEDINTSTGTRTPITTGTVTGFISTSALINATTADAALSVSGVYVGGNPKVSGETGNYDAGTWLFHLDASALTYSLLNGLFASAVPYFHVSKSNAVLRSGLLTYSSTAAGSVEE